MTDLLIRFDDASLTSFSWSGFEPGQPVENWQHSSAASLGEMCQKYQAIILLIPQQGVVINQVVLPQKSVRQVLSSIEYLVEDQLASDIDDLHFAISDVKSNQVSVAAVSKELMDRCQEVQKEHRFNASKILPEIFLCPWPDSASQPQETSETQSEVHVYCEGSNCLLRYGQYQGVKCSFALLGQYLNLIDAENAIKKVIYYCHQDQCGCPVSEQYPSEHLSWVENFTTNFSDAIELKQRQYQSASPWLKLIQIWQPLLLMLLLIVMLFGLNRWLNLDQLSHQLDQVKLQQYEVLKPYFPEQDLANQQFKRLLVKALQQNQTATSASGLLDMLHEFSESKQRFKPVEIKQFSYRNNRLSVDVQSAKLSAIEQLKSALESGSYSIKLENLTIKPEFSSGRLVIGVK